MARKPRFYQVEANDFTFRFLADNDNNRHPIVAMPTGTGKGFNVALANQTAMQQWGGLRILNLTHSTTLIRQNIAELMDLWPEAPVGVYSAKLGVKQPNMPIVFGGIASVQRNLKAFEGAFDLILTDECHLTSPQEERGYRMVFEHFKAKNKYLRAIGYTATPYRLGLGMLTDGGLYTDFAYDITGLHAFNHLVDQAYLMPLVPRPTSTKFDLSGVKIQGGELNQKQAQQAMNVREITERAVQETLDLTQHCRHILVFSQGIEHANDIARMFHAYGYDAGVYHSRMSPTQQEQMLELFMTGRLRILINADMLTTGFNMPALDCIVMLRATMSPSLWVQMLGRGTRPWFASGFDLDTLQGRLDAIQVNGKTHCLVLDFAGNTGNLGPINDPRIPKRKGSKVGTAPVKSCKHENTETTENSAPEPCGAWNHTSARFCINPDCRRPFHFKPTIYEVASTDELVAKTSEKPKKEPVYDWYDVRTVTYDVHTKMATGVKSILCTYFCTNGVQVREWVSLDHPAENARFVAHRWWRRRFKLPKNSPMPPSTDEAFKWVSHARKPVKLHVRTDEKYLSIRDVLFQDDIDYLAQHGRVPQ